MKNTTKDMPVGQPKNKAFFDKYYGWILLVTGLCAFVLVERGEFLIDFTKGMNDGYNSGCKDCGVPNILFPLFFILIFLCFFLYCVGEIFYHIFFKFILQKENTLYIIAFIVWLLVFYNLFWEGLHWLFDRNDAFISKFSPMKGIVTDSVIKTLLQDYQKDYATIFTALSFLLIITYGLVKYFVVNAKTQAQLIAQKSQAELTALKAQINPHFLFNVLNNLYGSAIVEESPKTSEGILQLSSIMRHVVEGTKNEKIEIEKEIRFLYDFIELNKMRIPNRPNISIETDINWDENPAQIAPLLVIPYIENAFKYGISINEESFIEMSFRVENQQLTFICKNSIIKVNDKLEVGTGTGLENTKRRLDLYYPAGYQLATNSSDNVFTVSLTVNL